MIVLSEAGPRNAEFQFEEVHFSNVMMSNQLSAIFEWIRCQIQMKKRQIRFKMTRISNETNDNFENPSHRSKSRLSEKPTTPSQTSLSYVTECDRSSVEN